MSWGGQEGKILERSWKFLVPEEKFLAPVPVMEQGQSSSRPPEGIPGDATEARSAGGCGGSCSVMGLSFSSES